MNLSKYKMQPVVAASLWDQIVEKSREGTVFSKSVILNSLTEEKPALWLIMKDQQVSGGLCIIESNDGRRAISSGFAIYAGLMLLPAPSAQSIANATAERFRMTCFCATKLVEMYDEVSISLSPSFVDIRPFLWHNYNSEGPHYTADVRFTSLVTLSNTLSAGADNDPIYLAASKSRRQQIRYGRQNGIVTESSDDIELFRSLYLDTFARQNLKVHEGSQAQVIQIVQCLIREKCGRLYISRLSDGTPGSAAVFGWDSKRAYYLYGANAVGLRDDYTGTMVIWDALLDLRAAGIPEVDLEGINSPLRGHFKLSFGGSVVPYYRLRLKR